jgi:hypothetical protein
MKLRYKLGLFVFVTAFLTISFTWILGSRGKPSTEMVAELTRSHFQSENHNNVYIDASRISLTKTFHVFNSGRTKFHYELPITMDNKQMICRVWIAHQDNHFALESIESLVESR